MSVPWVNLAKRHIWSEMQSLILTESIKLRGENVFVVDNIWRGFPNINVEITNKNWIRCFGLEEFNKRRKLVQESLGVDIDRPSLMTSLEI